MMNNLHTRTLCVLGASALLMGTAAGLRLQEAPAAEPIRVQASETIPASVPADAPAYLLGELDGVVAVFSGNGELLRLTDAPVAVLPEPDRLRLAEGIPVADEVTLAMLLEDYGE